MTALFHSFYARLSTIFLVMILALGAAAIAIAFGSAGHLFDEVEQLLNREYARSIAAELQPLVAQGFAADRIESAIHYMMVLNPMVEIYLVDGKGRIISYFAGPGEPLQRGSIDVAPLEAFVDGDGSELILGQDPRDAAQRKPFSAARLRLGGEPGYVYVILRGQSYDRSIEALRSSYYMRTGLVTFLLALLAALLVGLSLFFLVTRRLRLLSQAVRAFQRGSLDRRAEAKGKDELGALGRSFNDMAAAIQSGVERLRLAEQQRTELIANISHDLRSPLTSVHGYLESVLVKEGELTSEQRRELLGISLRNVASFQDLVDELFELVRLETRQVEPEARAPSSGGAGAGRRAQAQAPGRSQRCRPRGADLGASAGASGHRHDRAGAHQPDRERPSLYALRGLESPFVSKGQGRASGSLSWTPERASSRRTCPTSSSGSTGRTRAGTGRAAAQGSGSRSPDQIVELHGGTLAVESRPVKGQSSAFDSPFRLIVTLLPFRDTSVTSAP